MHESEEGYETADFLPGQSIVSAQFFRLNLSVNEMLNPLLVEGLIQEEKARFQ